jgi:hypothetical protein
MTDFIHLPGVGLGALTPAQKALLDCRHHKAKLPFAADRVYLRAPLRPMRAEVLRVTQ